MAQVSDGPQRRNSFLDRPAVIALRTGREYEGRIAFDGPWVHFTGRRRIWPGEYRPTEDRTWHHTEVVAVRWIDVDA